MPLRPRKPLAAALAAALPIALVLLGIWLGGHPSDLPGFLRSAFVADHDTQVVNQAIDEVAHDYYRPLKRSDLVNASIAGIVASLNDRFSNYLSPNQYGQFDQAGSFSGIGVQVQPEKAGLRVVEVFDQSPARRSGVHVGDEIVAVDGRQLRGIAASASTKLIEGPPGTDVRLTLLHRGRTRMVTVTREVVSEPVVQSELRTYHGRKLGVVALSMFSAGAHGYVREGVQSVLHQGARGIVLDLRHNGGGLVEEARLVASIFIPQGVIVTTRGRTQPTITLVAAGDAIAPSIPVVVLVDGDTASAAEIVTGALQDHHRATVVGTHTFGKGVFQEVRPLPNGGALDITVGQYFTPNGRNLGGRGVRQGAGITPNVPVAANAIDTDAGVRAALAVLAAQLR